MSNNPFYKMDPAYQASLRNAYKAAETRQPGFATVLPEGKYQCMISSFTLKENKFYADELQLSLGFEVLTGDQKGITVHKFYNINPENISQLKSDMTTLGVDIDDDICLLGEMKTADKILEQIVDITVKHKQKENKQGFYMNIYINRSLGKNAVTGFQEVEDDDELPFE